jgi:DNA-binding NarL/FixJ family response regulator
VRILLVDDDPDICLLVRTYFELSSGFEVVGEASDVTQAVAQAARLRPDVIVTDLVMGAGGGPEPLLRELRDAAPEARVVIFSGWDAALPSGADAYVVKGGQLDDLIEAIQQVG